MTPPSAGRRPAPPAARVTSAGSPVPVAALPRLRRVNVEITNVCNLRCPFCFRSNRPTTIMSVATFRGLAAQLVALADEVVLHVLGEPLTHPDLPGILAAAAGVGLPVNVVTNGVLLRPSTAAELLRPVVRQVSISLQCLTEAFPDRDHSAYLDRVLAFCDLALAQRPDLYLNLRLWQAQGVHARIEDARLAERLSSHFGRDLGRLSVDVRQRKNVPLRGRQYLHFDTRFEWPRMDAPEGSAAGTCHALKDHIGILADGTVVPCCLDADGVLRLGNALETPVSELLRGERACRMRDGFAAGRREEALCRRCAFVERFRRRLPASRQRGPGGAG